MRILAERERSMSKEVDDSQIFEEEISIIKKEMKNCSCVHVSIFPVMVQIANKKGFKYE